MLLHARVACSVLGGFIAPHCYWGTALMDHASTCIGCLLHPILFHRSALWWVTSLVNCAASCIHAMLLCRGWFHLCCGCLLSWIMLVCVWVEACLQSSHPWGDLHRSQALKNELLNNNDGALLRCPPYRRFKMKNNNTSTWTTYAY